MRYNQQVHFKYNYGPSGLMDAMHGTVWYGPPRRGEELMYAPKMKRLERLVTFFGRRDDEQATKEE